MSARLQAWVKGHQVISYFVLAYAITWILVSPLVLSGLHLTQTQFSPDLHMLGALGPLVAAFIVTALVAGRTGAQHLLARITQLRAGKGWILFVVFNPLLLLVLSVIVLRLAGQPLPDWPAITAPFADMNWLIGVFIASAIYGIGEEPGWRGFALPRMQRRWNALAAASVLAVFWGLWHAAFFTYRYQLGVGDVVGFFLGLLAGSIILTSLYNSSQGSVLPVMLWHVCLNVAFSLGALISTTLNAAISVEVMVAAIVVIVLWKPQTLSPVAKRLVVDESESATAGQPEPRPLALTSAGKD